MSVLAVKLVMSAPSSDGHALWRHRLYADGCSCGGMGELPGRLRRRALTLTLSLGERGPEEVEGEEAFEDLLVGDVVGPAVGVEDGGVEGSVEVVKPGGALVVKVGQGALLELLGGLVVDGQESLGERGDDVGDLSDPLGRVQPEPALVVQIFGRRAILSSVNTFVGGSSGYECMALDFDLLLSYSFPHLPCVQTLASSRAHQLPASTRATR